jgi:hypothetical protein
VLELGDILICLFFNRPQEVVSIEKGLKES